MDEKIKQLRIIKDVNYKGQGRAVTAAIMTMLGIICCCRGVVVLWCCGAVPTKSETFTQYLQCPTSRLLDQKIFRLNKNILL